MHKLSNFSELSNILSVKSSLRTNLIALLGYPFSEVARYYATLGIYSLPWTYIKKTVYSYTIPFFLSVLHQEIIQYHDCLPQNTYFMARNKYLLTINKYFQTHNNTINKVFIRCSLYTNF